jgi:hypothetical protein
MAAPASSGTNQQLTPDYPSFEKLLAAAWVLQCLHDQLHNPQVIEAEAIAPPVETSKTAEPVSQYLPEVTHPVIRMIEPPPPLAEATRKPEVVSLRPADDELLAKVVEFNRRSKRGAESGRRPLRRVNPPGGTQSDGSCDEPGLQVEQSMLHRSPSRFRRSWKSRRTLNGPRAPSQRSIFELRSTASSSLSGIIGLHSASTFLCERSERLRLQRRFGCWR